MATKNSIIFATDLDILLNAQIADCAESIEGAKLMSPDDLRTLNAVDQLIHVTFNSFLFGFIDDMYIMNKEYQAAEETITWR